jgi:multidrug efflux pump subunit AcrA (membrane-fusion protein)
MDLNRTLNRTDRFVIATLPTSNSRRTTTQTRSLRSHASDQKVLKLKMIPLPVRPVIAANDSPKSHQHRRFGKWLVAAFLAAVGVAAAWRPWQAPSAELASSHDPSVDTRKVVDIQRPALAAKNSVVLPGTLQPWQSAALSARVTGYLTKWHHDLGEHVSAGQLLAEIETPELDQEVAAAESQAREADAAVVQAEAELQEAQADEMVAKAQLVKVQAELDLAQSQLSRREKLVAGRVITQEEFDTYSRDVEARTAVVAAAESDVTRRGASLDTRAAIIKARQATARSRQSSVDRLLELQSFKRIIAPFDGVITRRTAEVGMLVTGRDALFVMEDMSRIRVQINVPQAYSVQTVPGVTATVTIPESSAPAVSATITRVSASVDSASRTMLAEIELPNPDQQFQPGSYSQVTLQTQQDIQSWTIPTNTVLMRVEGPHVAVVDDRDQIELRQVNLGRDLGSRVVVAQGIQGNERLVVNPRDDLKNGSAVKVNNKQPEGMHLAKAN